jgi:hypothetical protein
VGCDDASYATIGAALSAAPSGAVVEVCEGTYPESVILRRAVTLRARVPGERPVVQGRLMLSHSAEDIELEAGDDVQVRGLRFETGPDWGFSINNLNSTPEPAIDLLIRDVEFVGTPDPEDPRQALFLRLGPLTGGAGSARFEDLTVTGYPTLLRIQPIGPPDPWTVELNGFSFEGASQIVESDLSTQSGFIIDSHAGSPSDTTDLLVRLEDMVITGPATPVVGGIVLYARGKQRLELIDTVVSDHTVHPQFAMMGVKSGVDALVQRGAFLRNDGQGGAMIEVYSTLAIEGTDFGTGADRNQPFDVRVMRDVGGGFFEAGEDYHLEGIVGPLLCEAATGACN